METGETRADLHNAGVKFALDNCGDRDAQGQGYLFSRFVPPDVFERLIFP